MLFRSEEKTSSSSGIAKLLEGKTAVVHTLGILFEKRTGAQGGKGYKGALKESNPVELVKEAAGSTVGGRNPLEEGGGEYEMMNRDSGNSFFSPIFLDFLLTESFSLLPD